MSELPATAAQTTAQRPWPVSLLAAKIADYVAKMSPVWVEGEIIELNHRPGAYYTYFTLREGEASLNVMLPTKQVGALGDGLRQGAKVVAHVKANFWTQRGTLSMQAKEVRILGEGELLARIEELKKVLRTEGLFDPERKQPLPFLPRAVGLICGRESKAEHDVIVNARLRWPSLRFEIREVAVQGPNSPREIIAALTELDALEEVDVIVITRGGGSVEDLIGFSNEALVRAVSDARTPVVSAVGHETDNPLIDFVADLRASTPTDAAKRIVPDIAEERRGLSRALASLRHLITNRLEGEQRALDTFRNRPSLAHPERVLSALSDEVVRAQARADRALERALDLGSAQISHLANQVLALSPAATLQRGYAVVTHGDHVVRSSDDVATGDEVAIRLAAGRLSAKVIRRHAPTVPKEK